MAGHAKKLDQSLMFLEQDTVRIADGVLLIYCGATLRNSFLS